MKDHFGRQVDYLRISVTDRCNERCVYCMPADFHDWLPREQILSYEEILKIAEVGMTHMGMSKFRLTGGEPLVRRGLVDFVSSLSALGERLSKSEDVQYGGIQSIGMTTNALLLEAVAEDLKRAGVTSLNISLDALDDDLYHRITRGRLKDALAGIEAAIDAGFEQIKLNMVMLKGMNEDQVEPMLDFAKSKGLLLRMIELMPVTDEGAGDVSNRLTMPEMMSRLNQMDEVCLLPDAKFGHGPASYWHMKGRDQKIGFISAMTDEHFCETCNKLRLTADGFVRPCLGNHGEVDVKEALRGEGVSDEAVLDVLKRAMSEKPEAHTFINQYVPLRIMTAIGG